MHPTTWPHAAGELAELVHAHDWAATPLGSADAWPPELRAAVEQVLAAPMLATLAIGPERVFIYNDHAARLYGDHHPDALGRPLPEVFPQEFTKVATVYDRVFAGESAHVPAQPLDVAGGGTEELFDAYLIPLRNGAGAVIAAQMTGFAAGPRARAEAALRASEERQRFLLSLGDAMRASDDAQQVIASASRLLGEKLGATRIVFAEIDEPAGLAHIHQGWIAEGAESHPATLRLADFGGPLLDDLRAGHIVRYDDVGEPPYARPDLAALAAIGIHAGLSVPLLIEGQFVANVNVQQDQPRRWTDADIALVQEVAERLWAAVQRARVETALRDSEQRFRALATAGSYSVYRMSADWRSMRELAGGAFLETTTSPRADWIDTYLPPDDREAVLGVVEHAIETKSLFELEHRVHRLDGALGWTRSRAVPILDDKGAIAEWFGAASDITDRKRAEAAVRESEERLQALIDGIPQLVWRAVDKGEVTWASPQWTEYTGQTEADSHGLGWLDAVHPDDRPSVRLAWDSAIDHGEFHADYRIRDAEADRYRWFQTRATPVRDDAGRVVEWLGTSTDIDDLRTLQQRQLVLVAELQHRVRNMLTVVRSVFSRTMEMGADLDDVADHFKGRLDSLARTQVGVTQSATGEVDLELLIRDELLSVGAGDSAQVSVEGPDVLLPTKTAESIGLAIHELTTNALKYGALRTAKGQLKIRWVDNIYRGLGRRLTLTWTEQGVSAIAVKPARRGFGSELIEEALPYRLGAETSLQFRGGGVCCSISVPLPDPGALAPTN